MNSISITYRYDFHTFLVKLRISFFYKKIFRSRQRLGNWNKVRTMIPRVMISFVLGIELISEKKVRN